MMYLDVHASLLAFCKSVKDDLSFDCEIFDFDTNATRNRLPDADVIGVAEYTLQNDRETHTGTVSIIVSTMANDAELKRLRPVVDHIYSKLRAGFNIPVLGAEEGRLNGQLVVMSPLQVMPLVTTQVRPLIELLLHFGVVLDAPPGSD